MVCDREWLTRSKSVFWTRLQKQEQRPWGGTNVVASGQARLDKAARKPRDRRVLARIRCFQMRFSLNYKTRGMTWEPDCTETVLHASSSRAAA